MADLNEQLLNAAEQGNLVKVQQSLDRGANVNYIGYFNRGPLHFAASNGRLPVVQYLIQAGANINAHDLFGYTPLHYAVMSGHLPVAQYLIQAGANINDVNNFNETPLYYATSNGNLPIIRYLIDEGADLSIRTAAGRTAEGIALSPEVKRALKTRIPETTRLNIQFVSQIPETTRVIETKGPVWIPNIRSLSIPPQEEEQIRDLVRIRNEIDQALSQIPPEIMHNMFGNLVQ
jgi:ankyrin repeat protein